MPLPRIRPSFSLKTLFFIVTILAILIYQFRRERADRVKAEIMAELTSDGYIVLLGCQAPPGTAPESASQEVVYVSLGHSVYSFQDVLKTNFLRNSLGNFYVRYSATRNRTVDLTWLRQLTEVRVLDLADRVVLPDDFAHAASLSKLEVLLLTNTSDVTDEALRHISGLLSLRFLDFPNSQITDNGLEAIADLTNLEYLNLHEAKITGDGLRHLRNMHKLRSLNVSRTGIDDAGIAMLRGLRSLEELIMHETNITDEGLGHLHGLQKLTKLDVSRTRVSLQAMEALRKRVNKAISITR